MNTTVSIPRLPWLALALSFLVTGLGHIYCGRIGKGLILFCAWLLIPVLAVAAALLEPTTVVLVSFVIAPVIAMATVYLYAAIDAFAEARRTSGSYSIKEHNRGLVYVLLVAVGLIYPIGLVACVRALVMEAFYIPTASMTPALIGGDRILVNKIAPRRSFPQRGQLIVFRNPADVTRTFVARVMALPGDTVQLRDGVVLINGEPLQRDRVPREAVSSLGDRIAGDVVLEENMGAQYLVMINHPSADRPAARDTETLTVPDRNVFVMGDNRDRSNDSRRFGPVHVADIIGYPEYRYWPAATWARFGVL